MRKTMSYWKRGYSLVMIVYVIVCIGLYWIAKDQLYGKIVKTESPATIYTVDEILPTDVIKQPIPAYDGYLEELSVRLGLYGRENYGDLVLTITEDDRVVAEKTVPMEGAPEELIWSFDETFKMSSEHRYFLCATSIDAVAGSSVTIWYGDKKDTGRYAVDTNSIEETFYINDEPVQGMLCIALKYQIPQSYGDYYWPVMGAILLAMGCAFLLLCWKEQTGKKSYGLIFIQLAQQYKFLLKQLIVRDFKTKYKRSVLGVLWSFLNPLLTMLVQYIVFSTLFSSTVSNFPLYLLSGVVVFSFFTESVGLGLTSITGNFSLITKVYVPKYIYPIARVLSSSINMLISLVPLLLTMLITGVQFTKALLLLPMGLFFVIVFCIGMSLILSALMVFYRDIQFLWNVISMIWMYLTPLFYPESIIAPQYLTAYRCNPMYQFITFIRTIVIDGVSPQPEMYFACMLCSLVTLVLGLYVFRKNQDKFILYI